MAAIYRPRPACEPTPQELAEWVGGCLVNAAQAPGRLTGMGTLDTAEPSEFTFISDAKRAKSAETCRAGLFITPFDLDLSFPDARGLRSNTSGRPSRRS
jgi:UDP-3-O-[3-hydroxymyristoyl] glucosamine N-acyltransferase